MNDARNVSLNSINADNLSTLPKRQVLSDQVFDYILNSIVAGTLRTGEKINAEILSRNLGVSRTPIREALRSLEQMGLVESVPFTGYHVSKPTIAELSEIYSIRLLIEPYALEQAVLRVTNSDIENLIAIQNQIESILELPQYQVLEIFRLNQTFHMTMFGISGMHKLLEIIENLWYSLSFYRLLLAQKPSYPDRMNAEHHKYIQAFSEKDVEKLCYMCKKNLTEHFQEMPQIVLDYYNQ